jgi:hypothetical protein
MQLPSTPEHVQPASTHVPPQVGYGSPPLHGVRQKHRLLTAVHAVPGWLQPPPHAGAVPPEQNGGRQNGGNPGAGRVQVQPGGHPPGQGSGGGSERHAQYGITTSPQQVNMSAKHEVPAGQSPSPQLGYTVPHGVLPAGRQPQLGSGRPPRLPHASPLGHSPSHAGAVPPHALADSVPSLQFARPAASASRATKRPA